jgi:GTPase SAR1 family protein
MDSFGAKQLFEPAWDSNHYNKRVIQYNNIMIIRQDVYQHRIKHNFMKGHEVRGLVIVLDSTREQCKWVKTEILEKVLPTAKRDLKVLIFANKQDVKGALKVDEIMKLLKMEDYPQKDWFIMVSN